MADQTHFCKTEEGWRPCPASLCESEKLHSELEQAERHRAEFARKFTLEQEERRLAERERDEERRLVEAAKRVVSQAFRSIRSDDLIALREAIAAYEQAQEPGLVEVVPGIPNPDWAGEQAQGETP